MSQFVVYATGIFVCYQVIAGSNVTDLLLNHFWRCESILFLAAAHVLSRGFLHHDLERYVVLGGDAAAIFILGRVIGDGAVHAGNLDANLSPLGANFFPSTRQNVPHFISPPYT